MIIFDGHESHLTDEFTYYCWEHNIIPFRLPAHSTHLLQPLDIGVKIATEVGVGAIQDHKVIEWNTCWKCRLSEGTDDM
jgi:hypothetical protein